MVAEPPFPTLADPWSYGEELLTTHYYGDGCNPPHGRVCLACGEPGVPIGADRCDLCGEEQIEPFREGWDESD